MKPPHVVILGAGFGGVYVAKGLCRAAKNKEIDLTIVSRTNNFLFTPLLHEVATGSLGARTVAEPLREIFVGTGIRIIEGEITAIDASAKTVHTRNQGAVSMAVPYDYLVIATGAETNYYGIAGAAEHSMPLKTLGDAARVRNRVIEAFEEANSADDLEKRRKLLSFAVVGGGPTGVELAAELVEFIDGIIDRYHYCKKGEPAISIVHAGAELLEQFSPKLRVAAMRKLERAGVKIRAGSLVTEVSKDGLKLKSGDMVQAATVIWAAGVKASVPEISGLEPVRIAGRLAVDSYFRIIGTENIFALGDAAAYIDSHDGPNGKPLPQLAQAAEAEAGTVAANILAAIRREPMSEFHFHTKGSMVSVGQWFAIGEIYSMDIAGWFAWWIWRTVYLFKFASWKKRIRIAFEWTVAMFFPRDITKVN